MAEHKFSLREWGIVFVVFLVWLGARILFFDGVCGMDDLHHLRFAACWDRLPENHWETRIFFNGVLRESLKLFGYNEFSAALPTFLASLTILVGGLLFAWQKWRSWSMLLLTGVLLALLPNDVVSSSTPTARLFAAGFAVMGMFLLLSGRGTRWTVSAGVLFALAVWAHVYVIFFVLITILSAGLMRRQSVKSCFLVLGLMVGLFAVLEFGIFWLWTGDPFYEFTVIQKTHLAVADASHRHLWTSAGQVNWSFFWQPVRDLIFSKYFGVLGGLAVVGGLMTWRARSGVVRVLLVIVVMDWLWMSFGTQTPRRYHPFPLTTDYWFPLGPIFVLIVAEMILGMKKRAFQYAAVGGLAAVSLGLISLSGTWGQNVEISRELLAYAKEHPETIFVTDDRTVSQIYILNEFVLPDNLRAIPGSYGPLFVESAARFDPAEGPALLLVNPLNNRPQDKTLNWVLQRCGETVFQSQPRYRVAAWLLPESYRQSHSWTVRKPSARVSRWSGKKKADEPAAQASGDQGQRDVGEARNP
jgi:hypothetical protein